MTDSSANPAGGQLLKRLQSEAQMLFYTHPAFDAREALRLHPVNGFWLSGAGAIDHPTSLQPAPTMPDQLRSAALQADWTRWKDAWAALDAKEIKSLLEHARRGEPVTLTLCGERVAQRLTNAPHGATARAGRLIKRWLGNAPAWKTLETL